MNLNKYTEYVKCFSQLYHNNEIEILWRKNNGGLNVKLDLKNELPNINPSFKENEFIDVAFEVISISRMIAIDNDLYLKNDINDKRFENKNCDISVIDKIKVIKENFLNDKLIHYINVQTSSITNIMEDINIDILTKRSRKEPSKIITYSALLSLYIRDNHTNIDDEVSDRITVELTEQDIRNTINHLTKALVALENLKK